MTRATLLWFLALAALVAAPIADAAAPTLPERAADYRAGFYAVAGPTASLQNSDGGFGAVESVANGTAYRTVPSRASYLESVFTIQLLLAEDTDIYATRTNWEGNTTSLAASNVSNSLAWMRSYEVDHAATQLKTGEAALAATAYQALGDTGNARRMFNAIANEQPTLDDTEAAQTLFAFSLAQPTTNTTVNQTYLRLHERVNATAYSSTEGLAWSLLSQPERDDRREALAENLTLDAGLDKETLALGAWALAVSGGPDEATEDVLSELWGGAPTGLARTWYLLAERTAHPEFSPHLVPPPVPTASATAGFVSGAMGRTGSAGLQDSGAPAPPSSDAASDSGSRFPLPVWIMSAVILGALSVLVVVKLAYGLKREDLAGPRKDIFEYIEARPGEHFSKIRRDLNMAPGTFQHHLSVLESEGWITSFKDARYKRYFVNGNRYQKMIAGYTYKQKFAALANSTTRDLVRYVQQHPGATQKQVALRLNIHASTVNWHVKRLKQAGILSDERVGKEVRYTVDGDLVQKVLEGPMLVAA